MSKQVGCICRVTGSNFKDYVVFIGADYLNNGDLAMNDSGNVSLYAPNILEPVSLQNSAICQKYLGKIRSVLINNPIYQNNQNDSL